MPLWVEAVQELTIVVYQSVPHTSRDFVDQVSQVRVGLLPNQTGQAHAYFGTIIAAQDGPVLNQRDAAAGASRADRGADPRDTTADNDQIVPAAFSRSVVAEQFSGLEGRYVKLEDTIRSFRAVVDGEYDHIPEQCFLYCGAIEEVLENYEKMQATA